MQEIHVDSERSRPFRKCSGDAMKRHSDRMLRAVLVALVLALFDVGRPAAVARFIVAVGINPVQRCSVWSLAHVGEEGAEIEVPSVAHRNATPSVLCEMRIAGLVAPALCGGPGTVRRCESGPCGRAVLQIPCDRRVSFLAAATLCWSTTAQGLRGQYYPVATVAPTLPRHTFEVRRSLTFNEESANSPSGEIDKRWHISNFTLSRLSQAKHGLRPAA
jgi:hypothetical protein